jgi:lipoyl(octanoyl) transferase
MVEYAEALKRQQALFDALVARKGGDAGRGESAAGGVGAEEGARGAFGEAGWLVLCEHPHVYTLGRSGRAENMLVSEDFLRERGAALHRTGRGGDITYHGPGQLVVYPVLDLDRLGIGLRRYVEALEQAVIETVGRLLTEALGEARPRVGRVPGKTGVWVGTFVIDRDPQVSRRLVREPSRKITPTADLATHERSGAERKICAIGVKASRGVVMHGLALNVSTDLGWFGLINPCGMAGSAVTSIERETGRAVDMGEVKRTLAKCLAGNLRIWEYKNLKI